MTYTDDGLDGPQRKQHHVLQHNYTPDQLDAFAAKAESDTSDSLIDLAVRAANAILDAQGSFTVSEVREQLGKNGKLANDGKEQLGALGSLGRKMGCRSMGLERSPISHTHGHHETRWRRPTHEEMEAEGLLP